MIREGGYDEGICKCNCFWGMAPGSLLGWLSGHFDISSDWNVLDAGCGEGKNAAFFGKLGCSVLAIDISENAVQNGLQIWGKIDNITWETSDIVTRQLPDSSFDVVIAYGLLHRLESVETIRIVLDKLKQSTKASGLLVLCAFNTSSQNLTAHPGFNPTLIEHREYIKLISPFEVLFASDEDLQEMHPNLCIVHSHPMTRIVAKKPE